MAIDGPSWPIWVEYRLNRERGRGPGEGGAGEGGAGGGGAGGGRRQDPHLFDSTVQIQICDNNLIECMKTETEEAQKEDLPSVTYMNISDAY